uniref:G-protein coupled receptors family 1 profile domain-containing protein n=1 Tax=Cavia porcellus TaxID=10141 RepID=A0A286XVT9_CAVPO
MASHNGSLVTEFVLLSLNPHLHTPMYYFLFHLSFIDLCYSSVITPRILMSFVNQNIIPYAECMAQLFFFAFFVINECCILTSMVLDRYVAILGVLTFCGSNVINHYMCDIPPLLKLSCSSPSLTVFISYTLILSNIFCIHSRKGRPKTSHTCSSHIIAVSLFFGASAFMYLKPFPTEAQDQDKLSTVFYTIVSPMMNPFIYSLRNKDTLK